MALEEPMGRDTFCDVTSSSLSVPEVVVVGTQWALFETGEGACWPSTAGEGGLGEGEANSLAL